jgi:hypothetical protein
MSPLENLPLLAAEKADEHLHIAETAFSSGLEQQF